MPGVPVVQEGGITGYRVTLAGNSWILTTAMDKTENFNTHFRDVYSPAAVVPRSGSGMLLVCLRNHYDELVVTPVRAEPAVSRMP